MSQYSGQVTVSGVVQLPNIDAIMITLKGHPDNAGNIFVGNDGNDTISTNTGFPLAAGEAVVIAIEGNLNEVYTVAEQNNDTVCWILSDV